MGDCASPEIRVCLVEDSAEFRQYLASFLSHSQGIRFLHAYPSAELALRGIPHDQPDVVLMDINLPTLSGIECVRQLKSTHPQIQALMLTVYDDTERVFESLKAGASGYLLKRSPLLELLQSIQDVHTGGAPMTSVIARKVVAYFHGQPKAAPELKALTEREDEVLAALAEGLLYKEIADSLGITLDTVRKHARSIYQKLHVHSRTAAVVKYVRK